MDRYFIIFYIIVTEDGSQIHGNSDCQVDDGHFPPQQHLKLSIAQDVMPELGTIRNIIFTNILEVSQNDFIDWKRC